MHKVVLDFYNERGRERVVIKAQNSTDVSVITRPIHLPLKSFNMETLRISSIDTQKYLIVRTEQLFDLSVFRQIPDYVCDACGLQLKNIAHGTELSGFCELETFIVLLEKYIVQPKIFKLIHMDYPNPEIEVPRYTHPKGWQWGINGLLAITRWITEQLWRFVPKPESAVQ